MSKQVKHTPGPWEWSKCAAGIVFDSEGAIYPPDAEKTGGYQYSGPIAVVSTGADAGGEANGLLIAAAPEMFAACVELLNAMRLYQMDVDEEPPFKHRQMMERANLAVSKATGGMQ